MREIYQFPYFGLLAGIYPVIALWNFNKSQVYPLDITQSLLITIIFVTLVWNLVWITTRSTIRASVGASLLFVLFFSYGHVYNLINEIEIFGLSIGFVKLAFVYALLFVITFVVVAKVTSLPRSTVLILNGIFAILVVANIVQIINYEINRTKNRQQPSVNQASYPQRVGFEEELPDIYYIILDAYSRQDILQELMGYDNSKFIEALRERDFYVANCANSNYDITVRSITSSLNFAYLDKEGNPIDENGELLPFTMANNRIRSYLKDFGYLFVTSRGFSSENDINNPDIYLNVADDLEMKDDIAKTQFTRMYLETTLTRIFFEYYYMNPVRNNILPQWLLLADINDESLKYARYWYYQTRFVLDNLETFPRKEGNFLIYAHINAPHGPYVFDQNGDFRNILNPDDNVPYYKEMVIYINDRIIEVIDTIIADSNVPPIIILQADHGAHVITTGTDKYKILNAYYLPGVQSSVLYETITPVNTFRLVLREYFDQDIDLIPDFLYAKPVNTYEWIPSACEYP